MIQESRVKVNNQTVSRLGVKIDESRDQVEVDGRPVRLPATNVYLLLNKPSGYIVTADDPQKRKTVLELLPQLPVRLFPVGRLDGESEGALLFTNDGQLANRLMHPRYRIKKLYEVKIIGSVEVKDLEKLEKGIFIDGRKTAAAKTRVVFRNRESSVIQIEIHEGRKHEVRKMFYSLGFEVKKLRRVSFGGISIKGLRRGLWRYLKPDEVAKLRKITDLQE
jgi:23S rRNA pseudouridine2605 synthase